MFLIVYKDENLISCKGNDDEKKSTILNTFTSNSFNQKESPYKISQIFNNENKIQTINKIQSDSQIPQSFDVICGDLP
jgi:hypothetical protein